MSRRVLLAMAVLGILAAPLGAAATRPVPQMMRAAAFDKAGGPEVLSIHELPVPMPGASEVLLALHGAGVAVWEADMRRHASDRAPYPLVLGSDGAGTIVAVGSGVHGFKLGDVVYGTGIGFYAEYVKVRADRIARVPQGLNLTQASILAISGLSALQGIDDVLELKAGQTLIIHGAAGGVGTLAIQLAKLRGVKVLATATTDAGLALARQLGADAVVNGRTGDIAAAAKKFAPAGVDAVLGLAGGDALEHCIDALRPGSGRVAYLYGLEPIPRPRGSIRMTLYNFVAGTKELERLNKAVAAAQLRVPVAATYSLADAAAAHRRLEAGHLLGKIVLIPTGESR
ncbi:MAG TPA: NADP-dependent oxidoreductase [Steroidobacteraceae bacterium]|jgi:NADPH:quinone reductase-like Zn-dependent oxidoreductase|nr:NADP-dependent oxidoreductase [Steroidobacteraceae bacterium]